MNMEYREQNKKMGDNVYAVISEDQDMSAKVIEDLRDIEGTNKLVITNPLAYYDAIDKNGFVGVNFINQESLMINLDLIEGDINKISGNNIGASNDYNLNDTINITYYDGEQKEYKIVAVFESVPYLLLPKIYLDYSTNKYKHGLDKMNEKLFLMNDTMNKNDLQYKINKLSDNLKICSGDEDINMRLKKFSLHEFDTIVFMLMPCLLLATIVIIQNIIELVKSKQQEFSTLFRMGFSRTEMIIETMLESLIVLISADVMIFGILFTMLIKFKKRIFFERDKYCS